MATAPGLESKTYWQQRSEALEKRVYDNTTDLLKELKKQYSLAVTDVERQLHEFYGKYATENAVTLQEAQKELNSGELENYKNRLARLKQEFKRTDDPLILNKISELVSRARVTRFQALLDELDLRIWQITQEVEDQTTLFLGQTFQDAFYRTSFDIQSGIGIASVITKLNESAVRLALDYPWSGDHFSARIWSNREKLVNDLRQVITQGLIQGTDVRKMSRTLRDKMDTNLFYASRVIRTESSFILGEGTAKGYEANNLERYEVLSTLDSKTSEVCRKQDGKIYYVKDRVAGTNFAPFHPFCRTTCIPYFDDVKKEYETRSARDVETGKTQKLDRNMTYEEWEKRYVI
ncbi:minor capsid protein [Fictibacillus sp. 26RED30]|uniref:minor capsid protein n=1 Tax=Fictibacillus sp. 26RED30 TaxID=2745877 RepID=UPI0018CF1065|nr:minor capsid protein [Fictibacillus sp. 26RED30]MBH0159877.1 minor capsid protein [Fictibacillus sp. 26RED30]